MVTEVTTSRRVERELERLVDDKSFEVSLVDKLAQTLFTAIESLDEAFVLSDANDPLDPDSIRAARISAVQQKPISPFELVATVIDFLPTNDSGHR